MASAHQEDEGRVQALSSWSITLVTPPTHTIVLYIVILHTQTISDHRQVRFLYKIYRTTDQHVQLLLYLCINNNKASIPLRVGIKIAQ